MNGVWMTCVWLADLSDSSPQVGWRKRPAGVGVLQFGGEESDPSPVSEYREESCRSD